jgi:penicillin-binding protein 1C
MTPQPPALLARVAASMRAAGRAFGRTATWLLAGAATQRARVGAGHRLSALFKRPLAASGVKGVRLRQRFLWSVAAMGVVSIALLVWLRCGPIPAGLLDDARGRSTEVVDRHGVVLYEARAANGTRTTMLDADALPEALVNATLAAEDHRFWTHAGIDPLALGRAVERNLLGQSREGGSTITQQVAKLLIARQQPEASRARGWRVKLEEAVLALRLEHRLPKRQILALYLNLASYGNQLVGAERASQAYFGSSTSLLTPAQAAFLAALPQRPSRFNPYRDAERARARHRHVLARMRELGSLDAADTDRALAERLRFTHDEPAFLAPHFVDMVLSHATADADVARGATDGGTHDGGDPPVPAGSRAAAGTQAMSASGRTSARAPIARRARIETTLDAALQAEVQGIIRSERADLQRHGAYNVSVVVLDNATGEWLAWEGSGNYGDQEHGGTINGALTPRQPGSALKPFTYALAFEQGYSPAQVLPDIPSHFPTAEPGVLYSPRNYDGRFRGPLRARAALAGSENVPAVALLSDIGVPALVRFLRQLGFSTFDKTATFYGLGVTLGNAEVPLAELTAAYATFARGGVWLQPTALRRTAPAEETHVLSSRAAFWVTDILSDPDAREFVFGRGGNLEFPFPVAVKTGTSQGYHDNWTVGYTKDVTVGVWVGNFDRESLRSSSGVTGAGPIFHAVMLAAVQHARGHLPPAEDAPIGATPTDLRRVTICALSGMRANAWCPTRITEWLPVDSSPLPCSWHHQSDEGLLTIWPAQYQSWAKERGLLDDGSHRRALVSLKAASLSQAADRTDTDGASDAADAAAAAAAPRPARTSAANCPLDIRNPPPGAIYLLDPTLRRAFQTLPLQATCAQQQRVEWRIDGAIVGTTTGSDALQWPLAVGDHRITARDARGRVAETTILVK